MRQRLNDNPMFALALVGVLGVGIAFLFLTRMSGSSSESTAAPTSTTATVEITATTSGATTPPASTTPASPGTAATTPTEGAFQPGPGLPRPVVRAYNQGKIVVLLVFKRNGIDDKDVRRYVSELSGKRDVAIFQTSAKNITDYSRIAVGVDLNRVPAIVVVEPTKKSKKASNPQATVSYGFHGAGSIEQAIRDARYSGPEDLPTYPR
jgi:hypothetical protein